jgi:hypothetical protein
MAYSNVALKDKILEMYPDVVKHGVSLGLDYSEEKSAYVIKLKKDGREMTAYLDRKDADECMNNVKCVHLGVKVGEFIKNAEA